MALLKKNKRTIASVFLLLTAAVGVFEGTGRTSEEIIVSAASSLTNVMKVIGSDFENLNPGVRVIFNFAATGVLLQQMIHGAPVDVFASADQYFMDRAHDNGLVFNETRKDFAGNRLVLIAPTDSSFSDGNRNLSDSTVFKRIALGNPDTVPAGRYARQSLKGYGKWKSVAETFIFANSVRQVLDYVNRAEVDGGIVFETDAAISGKKVQIIQELKFHDPIVYPIAAMTTSRNRGLARRFIDFVVSEKGVEVLNAHGFSRP